MTKDQVEDMRKTKEYCKKHNGHCTGCSFEDGCYEIWSGCPYNWDIPELTEEAEK